MSFEEFLKEAFEYQLKYPSQRWGQAIFNRLFEHRPDLVSRIPDPFYAINREQLKDILEQLKSIWDQPCTIPDENKKPDAS